MLTRIADGVHVQTSSCIATNSIVIEDGSAALVIDPGLTNVELEALAASMRALNLDIVAGFATHPDWDHALWHPALGDAPRYGTAATSRALRDLRAQDDWREQIADGLPPEIESDVPLELFGLLTALPAGATEVPWRGPTARLLEHRGHAVGHAAVLIEAVRVLVAGDMLSDVLVPMPDLHGNASDPLGDYLDGLAVLEEIAPMAEVVIPGHGSVGDGDDLRVRIDADRAYIHALRDGRSIADARIIAPAPGWEWVAFIHDDNVERAYRITG